MIKLYPGGRFSGLLEDGAIKPGDELDVTGPYGVFTLRASSPRRLLFIGGGAGHGADPLAAALDGRDGLASARRPTTTAPAPRRTSSTSRSSARRCRLRFVPALSEDDATAGTARPG